MATREENLKKINDELEKLSDEELDGIAGGIGGGLRLKIRLKSDNHQTDNVTTNSPDEVPQFTKYGSSQIF
ncbi:MAG: hypothetical protein IJ685_11410 [Selenomonadaceae bacterium]|nr:hypothetical protein [Selenomonadaceae bacterium]